MCFSGQQSTAFAVVGAAASAILFLRKKPAFSWGLFLYFALMEALQALQYLVLEDVCPRPDGHSASLANQVLTFLSYAHICFQPLLSNWYIFSLQRQLEDVEAAAGSSSRLRRRRGTGTGGASGAAAGEPAPSPPSADLRTRTVLWLSAAAGVALLMRTAPAFWPSRLIALLPQTGTCASGSAEMMCDSAVQGLGCGARGRVHLAWKMKLISGTSYYLPSLSIHCFMMFVVPLVLCAWPLKLLAGVLLLTGPLLADILTHGDREAQLHEWASIWCMFSITQCLLGLVWEMWALPWLINASGRSRRSNSSRAAGLPQQLQPSYKKDVDPVLRMQPVPSELGKTGVEHSLADTRKGAAALAPAAAAIVAPSTVAVRAADRAAAAAEAVAAAEGTEIPPDDPLRKKED